MLNKNTITIVFIIIVIMITIFNGKYLIKEFNK